MTIAPLTVSEGLERQPAGPRSAALAGVRSQLEHVVGVGVQSVDDDRRVGAVDGEVVERVVDPMVDHLVQDDVSVAQLPRRRVPPQLDAGRRQADRREVLRRSAGHCNATMLLSQLSRKFAWLSIYLFHSFIQALKQVSSTVYSEIIMTTETVNKFRLITGRKSPLTRYHGAIRILQCYVANNSHTQRR